MWSIVLTHSRPTRKREREREREREKKERKKERESVLDSSNSRERYRTVSAAGLTYFPAEFGDQIAGNRREDERSYTGAADGDAVRQRATPVEVEADCYDGR